MVRRLSADRIGRIEAGFALLITLWALVLISFIVAHLTASGRTEVRIASNLAANATAQAAADGAIYQAIFNVADPRSTDWALDGKAHEVIISDSRVAVQIDDEADRINPNSASPALLQGLLRAIDADQESAAEESSAISEWVGARRRRGQNQELWGKYRAIGLDYAPPEAPIESIDELARVRGMTPKLVDALRPHLTLFGPAQPNSDSADPVVAAAVNFARQIAISAEDAGTVAAGAEDANNPDLLTARIRAVARGPGNAVVSRTAIVRIGPVNSLGYTPLAWGNGID